MTRIDFYLVNNAANDREKLQFTCRLAQKAYQQGHRIYIHADNNATCNELDHLLWTFQQDSFVPHALATEANEDTPVIIGSTEPPEDQHEVLINLAAKTPAFFSRFERMAEVIGGTEDDKNAGRERFRFYRDRGYPLETHQL